MIEGLAAIAPAASRGESRPRASGFSMPPEIQDSAQIAPPLTLAAMPGLLALQEAESTDVQDRAARQSGRDMLAELRRLQLGLLAPAGMAEADLTHLANLAVTLPYTADPDLRAALAAIALRAKIELARR